MRSDDTFVFAYGINGRSALFSGTCIKVDGIKMLSTVCLIALLCAFNAVEGGHYVRWGRTTCPEGASVVTSGYMGSTPGSGQPGNGGNYICLTDQPTPGVVVGGAEKNSSYVDGVSYQLLGGYGKDKPFSWSNNGGKDLTGWGAPCVICLRRQRADTMTIFGRTDCPVKHMQVEYSGYVMAAYRWNTQTEFICVDKAPEVVPGSKTDVGNPAYVGAIYPVQVPCKVQIPCPPYVNNNELSCVVCSAVPLRGGD